MRILEKWPVRLEEKELEQGHMKQSLKALETPKIEGCSEKRQENVEKEMIIRCVHFCGLLQCSQNVDRPEETA